MVRLCPAQFLPTWVRTHCLVGLVLRVIAAQLWYLCARNPHFTY